MGPIHTHELAIWTVVTILLCFQAWWYERQPIRPSIPTRRCHRELLFAKGGRRALCATVCAPSLASSFRVAALAEAEGTAAEERRMAKGRRRAEWISPPLSFFFGQFFLISDGELQGGVLLLALERGNTEGGFKTSPISSFIVPRSSLSSHFIAAAGWCRLHTLQLARSIRRHTCKKKPSSNWGALMLAKATLFQQSSLRHSSQTKKQRQKG